MATKQKRKHQTRVDQYHDRGSLFALFLQSVGFVGFIAWCFEEHIPLRFSLPPIVIGILILSSLFLSQLAHRRKDNNWWDDNSCSGWRGY